jgi:uncharacterized protein YkwD
MRSVATITLAISFAVLLVTPAWSKGRHDAVERAIVSAVNAQRAAHGLAGLNASPKLGRAADFHSWEMLDANYFDHDSRNGEPFHARVRRFADHKAVGETLAMLSPRCRAHRVVRMWMNSPGHRAILLASSFRRIGVGKRTGDLGSGRACVVTADFGSRR